MPLSDPPVDQLESYRGRKPRPADFDGYWERALDELDATDADVETQPSRGGQCFRCRAVPRLQHEQRRLARPPPLGRAGPLGPRPGLSGDKAAAHRTSAASAATPSRGTSSAASTETWKDLLYRHILDTVQAVRVFAQMPEIDVHHLASRITAPTLMITGLSDQVCAPSMQFAAYISIPAPKEYVLYPDYGHEGLPGPDDRIVVFFRSISGR